MRILQGVLCLSMILSAHKANADSPPITPFRWKEDYSYLADKPNRDWYEQIKYSSLGMDTYASFGGSVRERINAYSNDRFALTSAEDDGSIILQRALVHGDFHANKHLRAFVELGSYLYHSYGLQSGPFDNNSADIAQAFIDLKTENHQFRIGRQYSPLGSSRLISLRDGPNVRQHFDGIRTDSELFDGHITLLAMNETEIEEDGFDDSRNDDSSLWGTYTTWNLGPTKADIYYLGIYKAGSAYTQGTANETRHSLGTHLFGNQGTWDWNYELIYQFGDFGAADISAWTLATINGYTFKNTVWEPRAALSMNVASGDNDPNDNDLNTFNPLFPKLPYFEEATILVPQNFFNINPSLTLYPSKDLEMAFDWNFFWRVSEDDAVYTRGLRPLAGTAAQNGHFVTHVPSINIGYKLKPHIEFNSSYSHFFAAEVINDAGGEDVDFGMVTVTWSF